MHESVSLFPVGSDQYLPLRVAAISLTIMDTKTAEEVSAIMEEIEDRMGRKQPLILVYVTDPSVESSVTEEIGDSKSMFRFASLVRYISQSDRCLLQMI